jgi:lysozyme
MALTLGLAGCGGGMLDFDDGYPAPGDYPIHGIDVSKYQGAIDWSAVAGSGVKFAWIKATEGGDHADERFAANWAGAKAAGVPRGAYHFVYWCRPPADEIAWFEKNVPVEADALPPVLDVEATPESRTCRRRLEKERTVADMRSMLEEMERHYGRRPIIYTTVDFYAAILSDGALSDYPIWVRSTRHHPAVRYGSRDWRFWQYQADGATPGIEGHVDQDAFSGKPDQWQAFLATPQAPIVEAGQPAAPAAPASADAAADLTSKVAGAATP